MHNKWFTILVVLFIGYVLIKQPQQIELALAPEKEVKHEVIDKIKAYAELLTADPKELSLNNKSQPLIDSAKQAEVSPINSLQDKNIQETAPPAAPVSASSNPVVLENRKDDPNFNAIQNKIANVVYNVLHTQQGKELLEKILLNPRDNGDAEKKEEEPNPYNNNSILNIVEGEGKSADCGDVVKVHYITRLVNGQEIENTYTSKKPNSFQVGDGKVIKGLEYAVIGMKKGGVRRLVIPPRLAYNNAKFSQGLVAGNEFVTMDIELIDLKLALDDWENKITIFQKPDENTGARMLCSNEVYFSYKISTTKEQVLFSSKQPVSFTLGSSMVPAAINKAFSGIKSNAKRMVMIPSSLLYNQKISFLPGNIKLPAKEMLIFEINTSSIINKPLSN